MELNPSLFHHPPLGVSCGLLLLFLFPLIACAILRQRPFLPVIFFYTPLLFSLLIAAYCLYTTWRSAAYIAGNWGFHIYGWGIADAIAAIGYGAVSSFLTALVNLRVRRRTLYPVFPVTLAIAIAAWAGVRVVFERM